MDADPCETGPVWVSDVLRVLGNALEGSCAPSTVWFKESSQRNLRSRDFLVPIGALKKSFPDGEVPLDLIQKLMSLVTSGLPPVKTCQRAEAGLVIQLDRPEVFYRVLKDFTPYMKPLPSADDGQDIVILNCAPLHGCKRLDTLRLCHLRAALLADHLAEVLTLKGKQVYLVPTSLCKEVEEFLSQLGISWSCLVDTPSLEETVSSFKDFLRNCTPNNRDVDSPGVIAIQLKTLAENHNLCLQGYDPNVDFFHVSEDDLRHIARLQKSVQDTVQMSPCTVLHIVSCEEQFHQQKLDLLWKLMVPSIRDVTQKHLISGPVKVLRSTSPISSLKYFQLRKSQMLEASVMKYGECVKAYDVTVVSDFSQLAVKPETMTSLVSQAIYLQDKQRSFLRMSILSAGESWDEIIDSLTSAAIKFELMAIPHRSQVNLNLEEANITTKGTKSGAFVMYNCARLATMFDSYNNAVSQGSYPEFPPAESLNYSSLREEGEWLLLFNYIMMFPEVLSQSAQMSLSSPGIRVTANTEAVCKFLVGLSMDFSCYYNRVHILGEPLPHLFSQMFARLQLMKAVQSVLHSALKMLNISPPTQI